MRIADAAADGKVSFEHSQRDACSPSPLIACFIPTTLSPIDTSQTIFCLTLTIELTQAIPWIVPIIEDEPHSQASIQQAEGRCDVFEKQL